MLTDCQIVNLSPNPDDNRISAAASYGEVDLIVSGERKQMFALEEVQRIPVVAARKTAELISHR